MFAIKVTEVGIFEFHIVKSPKPGFTINPLMVLGHFWPNNFLFWIIKNHSFIGRLWYLVTFLAFGMWIQKKN